MKNTILIGIFFYCASVSGQSLKESLSGSWICNRIIDSANVETKGKFGDSGDFLKLTFEKKALAFTQAPFDAGLRIKYSVKNADSTINLALGDFQPFTETKYRIRHLSEKYLILQTRNNKNNSIYYVFRNQSDFTKSITDTTETDCGTILVKHLRLKGEGRGTNRVAEYIIHTNNTLYYPTPIFDDKATAEFGHSFSINFSFPEDYPIDSLSNELEVQFDVSSEGAENFIITKSSSIEFDKRTLQELEKSKKNWKPVIVNGEPVKSIIKLHFYFYLGTMNY